jgi:CRP-like cAMP-binding protein
MKTVIYLPNDEIIRQGDIGDKLYFISRGTVEVYISSDTVSNEGETF